MDPRFIPQNQSCVMWNPYQFSTSTPIMGFYPFSLTPLPQLPLSPRVFVVCPTCHVARPAGPVPLCFNFGAGFGSCSPITPCQVEDAQTFYSQEIDDHGRNYFPEFENFSEFADEDFRSQTETELEFSEYEMKREEEERGAGGGLNSKSGVKLRDDNHCALCKSNRETEQVYMGHVLKDPQGKVKCPILRSLTCAICGATGDDAHTLKYCPQRKGTELGGLDPTPQSKAKIPYRKVRNAAGKIHSLKY